MHEVMSVLCVIMLYVPLLCCLRPHLAHTYPQSMLRQQTCTASMPFAIIAGVCVMGERRNFQFILKACYSGS